MTPAGDKPLKRSVKTADGTILVVEITSRLLTLHPMRSKSPEVRVEIPWGLIYQHGLMSKIEQTKKSRKVRRWSRWP